MGRRVVGNRIRELREQRGLTPTALASKVSLNGDVIVRMESSAIVAISLIRKVAIALNVPMREIMAPETEAVTHDANSEWAVGTRQHRLRHYLTALSCQFGQVHRIFPDDTVDATPQRVVDLYVVPQLAKYAVGPESEHEELWNSGSPALEVLAEHSRVALLASAGLGKSTLVAWLAVQLADPRPNEVRAALGDRLPLPIVLRELGDMPDNRTLTWHDIVVAYRATCLGRQLTDSDWVEVERALESGHAMVLFDGLDEVVDADRRWGLVEAIDRGIERYPNSHWLVTSRTAGCGPPPIELRESRMRKIGFVAAWIVPFLGERIDEFVEKRFERREEAEVAASHAADVCTEIRNPPIHALARVPLFLSLLTEVRARPASSENWRIELFRRIFHAAVSQIPKRKNLETIAYSEVDLLDWLGEVGFAMQKARDADVELVSLTRRHARQILMGASRRRNVALSKEDVDRLVDYLTARAGLLVESPPGFLRFAQFPFQEFFAAWHIANTLEARSWWTQPGFGAQSIVRRDLHRWSSRYHWHDVLVLVFGRLSMSSDPTLTIEAARLAFPKFFANRETRETPMTRCAMQLLGDLARDPSLRWSDPNFRQRVELASVMRDIASCATASHPTSMYLPNSAMTSLELLREHRELWELVFCNTRVSTLEPFREHLELLELVFCETAVTSLEPLREHRQLRRLVFCDTGVTSLEPLRELRELRILHFGGTGVTSLEPLRGHRQLRELSFDRTAITDLEPLRELRELQDLCFSSTRVTSLEPLRELRQLRRLVFTDTAVTTLEPLHELRELEWLQLGGKGISKADVAAMRHALPKCRIL